MNPWQRKEREKLGVEVVVSEFPDWLFRVRAENAWNTGYHRAIARLTLRKDVRELLERQEAEDYVPTAADDELDKSVIQQAFAEGCVAGWSGVTGADGEPLEFSTANVVKVLETFPEIFHALRRVARDASQFAEPTETEKAKALSGNSEGASSSKLDRGAKPSRSSRKPTDGTPARPA